jgi:hypothetical protein
VSLPREWNPVAYKDLLVFARTPGGGLGMRALWVAVALSLPLLVFAWVVNTVPGPWRFAARPVFLIMAALLALFNFSVAVPAATAFALERDRETLEGLVVSPLSPWRLVLGKLFGALAIGMFTKTAMLPPLALAFALGGADLSFLPAFLLMLLASDVSFASFALLVGARRLEASTRVGWLRAQTSQAQLALQSSAALSVVASLVPIYAAIFLVPLAYQQGIRLDAAFDAMAPLGVLHPLAALVLWGPVDLFGVRVPVWILGTCFHLLVALPLLADAAEAQQSEGTPPGRAPRLLFVPAALLLLLLTGSTCRLVPGGLRAVLALGVPTLLLLAVALRTAFVPGPGRIPLSRRAVLRGFRPDLAVQSAPARAPGYVLLIALACVPLVVWGLGAGPTAWLAATSLLLMSVGLSAVGAALVAWDLRKDDRAFLAAVRAPDPAQPSPPEGDLGAREAEEADRRSRLRGRVVARALLLTGLLPLLAAGGIALGQDSVPALSSLEPLFSLIVAAGMGLNPLASVLPALIDPQVLGSDVIAQGFLRLGIDPWLVYGIHLISFTLAALLAILTLRQPLDLQRVLGEHLAQRPPP